MGWEVGPRRVGTGVKVELCLEDEGRVAMKMGIVWWKVEWGIEW